MTNNKMKASIVVDLDDKKVASGTRGVTRNVNSMSQNMIRSSQRINAQYKALNNTLGSGANQMIGYAKNIVAAYGGVQAVKMVWEFNDGINELQRRTNLSNEEMERYKQLLFDIQLQYGVSKQAFGQYIDEVARGVQTYEELEEKARNGAIAIKGLGMSGIDAANFDWMMQETNVVNPEAVLNRAANIGQNSNGRFNGSELLSGVYEVMKDWSGPKDQNAIYDIMTFLQLQSKDTQSMGEAVENFKALISGIESQRGFLDKRFGMDAYERTDDGLVLKSLQPIIDLIFSDTQKGQEFKGLWYDQKGTLTGRLSEGGAKTVMSLANSGERFNEVKESEGMNAESIALDRSHNFSESMEKLMSVLERFADMNLAGPIDELSRAISELDPAQVQEFLEVAGEITKWVGGAYVAYKGMKIAGGAIDTAKSVFTSATEIQKVFVTNMAEARQNGGGAFGGSNMNKHMGMLGVLANLQFVSERLTQDGAGAKELRAEYGDENINRWMDEQGYSSFMRNLDGVFFDEIKEVIAKGLLTDEYGAEGVTKAYQDQLPWYEPKLDLKQVNSEDLSKIIQDNAATLLSQKQEVEGHVNVDSNVVVTVQAAAGLVANVQSKDIRTESSLKSKLGYTGGGKGR